MRHRVTRRRLPGKPAKARMMERNLATSLILYEAIRTTRTRAKFIQAVIDRLLTIARTRDSRNAIRTLNAYFLHENATRKVMEVLKERFKDRPSGLTTLVPVGARKGDGAAMVDLALIGAPDRATESPTKKPTKEIEGKKPTRASKKEAPKK